MRSVLFNGLLVVAPLCACVDSDETTAQVETAIESPNALSLNALSLNALSLNALSLNALSQDGLIPGFSDDSIDHPCNSELGRELLRYTAACALPTGTSVRCAPPNNWAVFHGHIGLAPLWMTAPLNQVDQRWVSACLLAHVNGYAVPVQISLTGAHPALARTEDERALFVYKEADFYGNLFTSEISPETKSGVRSGRLGRNACQHGVGAWPINSWYLRLRVCALPGTPGATQCNFVDAGRCRPPTGQSTSACLQYNQETDWRCAAGQIYPGWMKEEGDGLDHSTMVTDQVISVYLRRDQAIDLCTSACLIGAALGLVPLSACQSCAETIDDQLALELGGSAAK